MQNDERANGRAPFADRLSKAGKGERGQTAARMTPLAVRATGPRLDAATRSRVRERFGRRLGKFAPDIERITVRFEDLNGPRGGVDTACHVKVVLSGLDSVLVTERATDVDGALGGALDRVARSVRRTLDKAATSSRATDDSRRPAVEGSTRARTTGREAKREPAALPEGSLIGRRVGQGRANLRKAQGHTAKGRRDQPVDTAEPGLSASDRRAGGGSTAARNAKLNQAGLTSALEDSAQSRPSRKSTRKAAGRAKRDSNLQRRAVRKVRSPKARASAAAVR